VAPVKPPDATIQYVPTPYAVKEPCFKEEDRPPLPVYTFNTDAEVDAASPEQLVAGMRADKIVDCRYQAALERLFIVCRQKEGAPVTELAPLQCGSPIETPPKEVKK
jgi:hypothetical protein